MRTCSSEEGVGGLRATGGPRGGREGAREERGAAMRRRPHKLLPEQVAEHMMNCTAAKSLHSAPSHDGERGLLVDSSQPRRTKPNVSGWAVRAPPC